jgi:O-antigen ligase
VSALPVLAAAHGLGEVAEKLGVIALALLAALAVLGRSPRISECARALAMLAALALAPVLLAVDIWHTSQLTHLRHHPAELAGACVLGVCVVAALAVTIDRAPRALPLLAIFALPFRLPIATGGGTSNLLIPLYLVVGAGVLAWATPRLVGRADADARAREGLPPGARLAPAGSADSARAPGPWAWTLSPRGLEWLLMAAVVLYALQASYSADFAKALENTVFFYVPFALLFALLREVRWTRELALRCLALAVALAVVFAGIGFVEYERKRLFLNPKVVAADQYGNYFRVNSLFFDPNIYGRFLALTMIGVMTGVLWSVRRRAVLLGGAVLLWMLGGLVTSFSQSSIAALLLGLAVLAAYRWDVRATIYVAVAITAIALVAALAAPPSLHLGLSGKGGSASNATSGRTRLIEGGLRLFADRPLQGYGPGSFAAEYRAHERVTSTSATSASHTIPVTVAAEQGVVGLVLYLALLVSAFAVLFRGAGRSPTRIALAACWAALVLHTFAYADFLEDPETWVLLGVGLALLEAERPRREAHPVDVLLATAAGRATGSLAE